MGASCWALWLQEINGAGDFIGGRAQEVGFQVAEGVAHFFPPGEELV